MKFRNLLPVVSIAALMVVPATVTADTIDPFTDGTFVAAFNGTNSDGGVAVTSDFSSTRTASVFSNADASTLTIGGGTASLATGLQTIAATFTLDYNLNSPADLSGFLSVDFTILAVNEGLNGPTDIGASLTLTDGNANSDTENLILPGGTTNTPDDFSFILANFGVDLSNITDLQIQFTSDGAGQDFTLGGPEGLGLTPDPGPGIPEPTSLALWGIAGIGGLIVARRRRSQKAAA